MLALADELILLDSLGDMLALPLPDCVILSFGEDESLLLTLADTETLTEVLALPDPDVVRDSYAVHEADGDS
jgi:hypothetical protein